MIAATPFTRRLTRIADELRQIAANATDEHPCDAHEVHCIALQVECLADAAEKGLVE